MTTGADNDFLSLEDELTDEEQAVQDMVRGFVTEAVLPVIEEHTLAGTFPLDLVPSMGELGFFGAMFEGYGCTKLSGVGYGILNQELERGDSGLRSFVSVQTGLVMYPIFAFGTGEQKQRWLPELAAGRAIGCFGLTEADFGSNPSGLITTAKRDGGDYVLNGSKMWITNGSLADVSVIWAKLDGEVRGFLVEKGSRGYSAHDIKNKFSLKASVTSELVLDEVRVPASSYLPGSEIGIKAALMCLNQARYGISWGAVGAASSCYEEALRYSKSRVQFSRPIAGYQLVQKKLVEMLTEISKAQLLCLRLGRMKDEGKLKHYHVSMAKMNNVKMALDAARTARDILGAAGICFDYHCARHLCNLESVFTYEGTHDIHTLIVGEKITGISAVS